MKRKKGMYAYLRRQSYKKAGAATKNLCLAKSPGRIILLNGTSSSGKTIIAKKLKEELPTTFLYLPIDIMTIEMLPKKTLKNEKELLKQLSNILMGYYYMIDGLVRCGNNVIVDLVFQELNWLKEALKVLHKYNVLFIGVKSSLADAEKRERQRQNRATGQARYQFQRVHRFCLYDIEVNTSQSSPSEIIKKIKEYYRLEKQPRGFRDTYINLIKNRT